MNKPINSTINNLSTQTTFKELSDEMSKYDIISFDLFDTLIERCFHRPTDLFYFIEHAYQAPGFARHRMKAQKTARKTRQKKFNDNEITISEIYQHIRKDFNYLYDIELETEIKSLTPKFDGINLLQKTIDLDKKIIIATDTYFTKSFIVNLLVENGIKGYHDLFVSSELRKSKISGSLYDHIKANLNLSDKKILHIGDNFDADVKMARNNHIDSFHLHHNFRYVDENFYKRVQRRLKKRDFFYRKTLQDLIPKFSVLQRVAEVAYRKKPEASFWEYIGIFFAGPMIMSFVIWIQKCIKTSGCQHVMFVARDGYILQKIFEQHFDTIPSSYHYLNRSVVTQLRSDEKLRDQYKNYLNKLDISQKKTLLVDSQTGGFSAQGICSELGIETVGCYWQVNEPSISHKFFKFFDYQRIIKLHKRFARSNILEFFMSAPYLTAMKIKFNGDQLNVIGPESADPAEYTRIECAAKFKDGVDAFIAAYFEKVSNLATNFDASDIVHWIDVLLCHPSEEERKHFLTIAHQNGFKDNKYRQTFRFMKRPLWRAINRDL